jgi:hypothetical protein
VGLLDITACARAPGVTLNDFDDGFA